MVRTRLSQPERFERAAQIYESTQASLRTVREMHPGVAPTRGEINAAVAQGCALLSAGRPLSRAVAPWARAGTLLEALLADQARRFGFVEVGVRDFPTLCAAWLAAAEKPVRALLDAHPTRPRSEPRGDLFGRLHEVFTQGVVITSEERASLERVEDLRALSALVEAADAEGRTFAACLQRWLDVAFSEYDRKAEASRDSAWPYAGPVSVVASALVARRPDASSLAGRFVPHVPASLALEATALRAQSAP